MNTENNTVMEKNNTCRVFIILKYFLFSRFWITKSNINPITKYKEKNFKEVITYGFKKNGSFIS